MTGVLILMFIFLCVSVIDKINGSKYGYGEDFDKGLATMGPVSMCIIGLYGMGTYILEVFEDELAVFSQTYMFDPSIIVGTLLSLDYGALPICLNLAEDRAMGLFSGVVLASTIGATISFSLPTCLSVIRGERDVEKFLSGAVIGIALILPSSYLTGLLYDVPINTLFINSIPLTVLCIGLMVGFSITPKKTTSLMGVFGNFVMILCLICFAIVSLGLLFPKYALIDSDFLGAAVLSTAKMAIIIIGSLSFTKFIMRHFSPLLRILARVMKTNEYSVVGLILTMTTCVAMLPIFKLMDRRGQKINAAFAISGSFIIGGQMSYASNYLASNEMVGFFTCKALAGILAIVAVCILDTKQYKHNVFEDFYEKLGENTRRKIMDTNNELLVNISIGCSEQLMNALNDNPELNAAVNEISERFFNSDWGDVSEDVANKNDAVILRHSGKITAAYNTENGGFSFEMRFSDKENAMVMVDFL